MPETTPPPSSQRSLLPQILHAYVLLFQLLLAALLFHLHGNLSAPLAGLTADAVYPQGLADPLTAVLTAAGVFVFILGFTVPSAMIRRGIQMRSAGSTHPLSKTITPYIVRVCLFEATSLFGFVLGFLKSSPFPMLPLLALGIAGMLLSLPTPRFFARFSG